MTSGEASILGKLEQLEHNQKKIMEALLILSTNFSKADFNTIQSSWEQMVQELKEHKKLKAQAKRNGYTLSQWKKKLEEDK